MSLCCVFCPSCWSRLRFEEMERFIECLSRVSRKGESQRNELKDTGHELRALVA